MHRCVWKRLSETLVERSRAPSQISSSLQTLRLLGSVSISDCDTKQEPPANRHSSVLTLFEDCGFSQIQAESIVSRYPKFLHIDNPEKTIKPKISFLHSIGIPEDDVAKMVTAYPLVLRRSLSDHLIPSFDLLKNLLGGEHNAISLVKSSVSVLDRNIPNTLAINLSALRKQGVPQSDILKMMTHTSQCTRVVLCAKPDWFSKVIVSVMTMGFDTSSAAFANAVTAMGLCNESTWEDKLKFYEGLGFSRDDIFSMFRKQPLSLCLSRKKVREAFKFYNNKCLLSPPELALRPILLFYALHKRVIPRCSALQVLWSRNRINNCPRLVTVLNWTEKVFLERYVTKYQVEVPEVLDAYQGKLHFDEFTFDSGKNEEHKAI